MTSDVFFFDSYAMMEILGESKNYLPYVEKDTVTTKLNLYEVYYHLLKKSQEEADEFIADFRGHIVEYDMDVIIKAAKLKRANQRFSLVDTIGYITALKHGILFLTGDKEFKDMPNVEYVK